MNSNRDPLIWLTATPAVMFTIFTCAMLIGWGSVTWGDLILGERRQDNGRNH